MSKKGLTHLTRSLLETRTPTEQAALIGIFGDRKGRSAAQESLQELEELALSAGAQVIATFLQERKQPGPAYLIGTGKLNEIRERVVADSIDVVIFDEELSPAQLRNLEDFLETKVVDRSELILDIFAQRARSREGKLQVELAQLEYLLPRLTGKGVLLSRLGGGIGTRGPGETKLEVDRRTIRSRISKIRQSLVKLEKRRSLHRAKRQGVPIPTASLVGYTNAGKSTLFNRLTSESTFASPRLFATLDPLIRKMELPSGQEVLLSDTVGFIRKLPHTLVAAFHATLEETLEADLLIHLIDAAHPGWKSLREAVLEALDEIGAGHKPTLEVYNKVDLLAAIPRAEEFRGGVLVSARTGQGIEELNRRIEDLLFRHLTPVQLTIPFDRGDLVSELRQRGRIEREEYAADGIHLQAALNAGDLGRFQEYLDESK